MQNDSLEFMVPESIDEDINATPPPNLTRMFAEGRVYSGTYPKMAEMAPYKKKWRPTKMAEMAPYTSCRPSLR